MNSNWYLITVAHGAVGWIKHSGASPYGKIMYIYLDIILQYWTSLDWTLGQFSMCIMLWSIENKYLNVKAFIVHYYSSLIWSSQMLLTQSSLYLGAAASPTWWWPSHSSLSRCCGDHDWRSRARVLLLKERPECLPRVHHTLQRKDNVCSSWLCLFTTFNVLWICS